MSQTLHSQSAEPHELVNGPPTPLDSTVPSWALIGVTWINSLGSGLLWSGVPFITEHTYGFTPRQNLLLALILSVIYVGVALSAGPLLRHFQRNGRSTRAWISTVLVVQLCCSPLVFAGGWGLVAAACVLSGAGASLWPVMESYASSGRHGHSMRRAIGIFNVSWMSATGVALLLLAPLMAGQYAELSLLVMIPVSALSLIMLRWFPRRPAPHSSEETHTHVPPGYRGLLRAVRFILPVSYVFVSVLGPLLPFQLKALGLEAQMATPLASVWMFARLGTAIVLALLPFWHGRWGAIALGVALLAGGFAAVILANDIWLIALGLAAFGAGHGLLYYAALYYAMAVGSAGVEAAGVFEALIGVGYVIGPSVALLAGDRAEVLVGTVWGIAGLGMLPALLAWWRTPPNDARTHRIR